MVAVFIYEKVATLKLRKARSLVVNFFCGMIDWQKVFSFISSQDHIQRQILTIANLWCATSRISTCTELEVRLCWLKLSCFDIHYTTTVPEMELFFNSFDEVGSWFLDDVCVDSGGVGTKLRPKTSTSASNGDTCGRRDF